MARNKRVVHPAPISIARQFEIMAMTTVLAELDAHRTRILVEYPELQASDEPEAPRRRRRARRVKKAKLHWTQRPENKAKVKKALRAAKKARDAKK